MLPEKYQLPKEWKTTIDRKSVVDMVQTEKQRREDEQWKFKINGKEVIVREVFEKTLTWLQKLEVVGEATVEHAPVNASLPWAGFRALLKVKQFSCFSFNNSTHVISRVLIL